MMDLASSFIDHGSCSGCKTCVQICPLNLIEMDDNKKALLTQDHPRLCISCGQCMAICKTEAIHIQGLSYEQNFSPIPEDPIQPKIFEDLLSRRRSIRTYKDKPVSKETIQRIVDLISLAPMGFPPHKTHLTIISDKKQMKDCDEFLHRFYQDFDKMMNKSIVKFFVKRKVTQEVYNTLYNHLLPITPLMVDNYNQGTKNKYTYNAPGMMIFHAEKGAENHTPDGYIALAYGLLACESLGLGAIAMGIIAPAINRTKAFRQYLKIPENHEVLEVMLFGHPRYHYRKTIKRPMAGVHWL